MTANMTFMPFLCCHLITTQDRPHKVYISLKLRALIMFGCDGISDHASWNEVFHYRDTKLSCVSLMDTPQANASSDSEV